MRKMKLLGRIMVTVAAGLFYLSCKSEDKTVIPARMDNMASQQKPVEEEKPYEYLNTNGLEWSTMENIPKNESTGSKMYLIDIYTEWCGWCKMMDRKTFSDTDVQEKLKESCHLVKLNAESQQDLEFNGKLYKWRGTGKKGIHELAAELMKGKIEYPTLIFTDENFKTVRVSRGYQNPKNLLQELEMALKS